MAMVQSPFHQEENVLVRIYCKKAFVSNKNQGWQAMSALGP
jgi:hypothetical protein